MSRDVIPKLSVGIDFGTTYSGVSWALSTKPEQIKTVTDWQTGPSTRLNSDKLKAPSKISYGQPTETPTWGYQIPVEGASLKWFKLLLIDENDLQPNLQTSSQVSAARAQLLRINKTAIEVISDYLRELWCHALTSIVREVGTELFAHTGLIISITLPAIWPAYAQARMREAVTLAGILDEREAGETIVRFISEPEAAALATIDDMANRPDIKENDHMIICDAGGGTVDIITYTIVKTSPLVVRESIRGDGALCGAIFLDEAFHKLLKRKISRDIWQRLGDERVARIMNNDWENGAKRAPADDTDWPIHIPIGGTSENNYQSPEIVFRGFEIRNIFHPIMLKIEDLVTSQLIELKRLCKKQPKFIILVGGFGKSSRLYDHLRAAIHKNIDILQSSGDRPWTAICRGAVINGLNRETGAASISVDSRISRASYGTVSNILPWDPLEHDPKDKSWCSIQQEFLAVDQVKWFLQINDQVIVEKPIVHSFWQDFEKQEDDIITELVVCHDEDPPSRCTSSVKQLCKIRWSKIPNFETLPIWTNPRGKKFRHVCYEVKMTVESGSLDFAIYHEGMRMASQNVSVEHDMANEAWRVYSDSDTFSDD